MPVDAEKLRKLGRYETKAPLQSLLDDLDQIGQIVASFEAHRRTIRRACLWCLLGFVLGLVAGAFGVDWMFGVAFVALALCIGLFIRQLRFASNVIGNRKRGELLKNLLPSLQWDSHNRASFAVNLSFRNSASLLSESNWSGRRKGKEAILRQYWLNIEGPLLDGTTFSEEVVELSRKRTYLNPRGKRKMKTRSRYQVTLRLLYPKQRYGDARAAHAALREPLRVPDVAKVSDVSVTEKSIAIKALVTQEKDIPQAAEMLCLGAYRILNLARHAVARQRGAK